jgi:hypothetical protein
MMSRGAKETTMTARWRGLQNFKSENSLEKGKM